MEKIKVSVIITCYNYAKYLPGCIESVLNQTWQDFEIIVVNDGSTDNTDDAIASYLSGQKILYIKQKNSGQANAKNNGIRHSKGELIAFLDADDLWDATKLEKQLPLFRDPRVGVVYNTARYIDEQGREFSFMLSSEYLKPRSGVVTRYLLFDNFVPFSSSVVRRDCLDRAGIFDETISMGIDWDLWLRISVHYEFQYIDEPLLLYRFGHSGQMSKNLDVRQRCSDTIMAKFIQANPNLAPARLLRRVRHYTFLNRGHYYHTYDMKLSSRYFMKALCQWPFALGPYRGLIKNVLKKIFR